MNACAVLKGALHCACSSAGKGCSGVCTVSPHLSSLCASLPVCPRYVFIVLPPSAVTVPHQHPLAGYHDYADSQYDDPDSTAYYPASHSDESGARKRPADYYTYKTEASDDDYQPAHSNSRSPYDIDAREAYEWLTQVALDQPDKAADSQGSSYRTATYKAAGRAPASDSARRTAVKAVDALHVDGPRARSRDVQAGTPGYLTTAVNRKQASQRGPREVSYYRTQADSPPAPPSLASVLGVHSKRPTTTATAQPHATSTGPSLVNILRIPPGRGAANADPTGRGAANLDPQEPMQTEDVPESVLANQQSRTMVPRNVRYPNDGDAPQEDDRRNSYEEFESRLPPAIRDTWRDVNKGANHPRYDDGNNAVDDYTGSGSGSYNKGGQQRKA